MRFIFYFLALIGCFIPTSYSMDFFEERELGRIVEDKLLEDRMNREIERDIQQGGGNVNYNPVLPSLSPSNPVKYFGKDDHGTKYSIPLESIYITKTGGKFFIEFSESKLPRYEDKFTYFSKETGYVINCDKNEIRKVLIRLFDVKGYPININPNGKNYDDKTTLNYPVSVHNYQKIETKSSNSYSLYKKFICR